MKPVVVIIALVLLTLARAHAAESPPPLTMSDVVRLALANHPSALAAQHRMSAAQSRLESSSSFLNPEVSLTPFFGRPTVGGSDDQFVLSQRFDLSGRQRHRVGVAGGRFAGAKAEVAMTQRNVALNAKVAYIELQLAREIVVLNESLVAIAELFRDAAQKQFDVGNVPRVQIDRAEIELARAEQELLRAQSHARIKEAALNVAMGREASAPIALADGLKFAPAEVPAADTTQRALAQRSEVRAAEAELRVRRSQISIANAERLPDLRIEGVRNKLRNSGEYALRVGFVFPLFDFGAVRHETRAARADVREQESLVLLVKNDVRLQVVAALTEVQQARALVERYERDIVPRTERLTQTIQKGFNAGASTQLDVLDAQRTLRSVQTEYRQAMAEYAKALAELEWATESASQPKRNGRLEFNDPITVTAEFSQGH